jgi:hypothetical protein
MVEIISDHLDRAERRLRGRLSTAARTAGNPARGRQGGRQSRVYAPPALKMNALFCRFPALLADDGVCFERLPGFGHDLNLILVTAW